MSAPGLVIGGFPTHGLAPKLLIRSVSMQGRPSAPLSLTCLAILVMLALPARPAAAAGEPYAAAEVLRGLFVSYDYNRDGRISVREVHAFSELISVSMDTNDDGRVSVEEFLIWDPGFASLAD